MKIDLGEAKVSQPCTSMFIYVYLYEDLIYIGNSSFLKDEFKKVKVREFEMNNFCLMHYFLEMKVHQTKECIFLGQSKYVQDIVKRFGLTFGGQLIKEDGCKNVIQKYRSLVGSLMYLTSTRPDLSETH